MLVDTPGGLPAAYQRLKLHFCNVNMTRIRVSIKDTKFLFLVWKNDVTADRLFMSSREKIRSGVSAGIPRVIVDFVLTFTEAPCGRQWRRRTEKKKVRKNNIFNLANFGHGVSRSILECSNAIGIC